MVETSQVTWGPRLPSPTPGFCRGHVSGLFQMLLLSSEFRDSIEMFARPPSNGRIVCLKKANVFSSLAGKVYSHTGIFFPIGENPECQLPAARCHFSRACAWESDAAL